MAKVDVIMPQMGESIAEGTVLRYLKKVGEAVKKDEDILEISTDKVDATVPSPESGTLAEIVVEEGQTVEINAVLARVETDGAAAKAAGGDGAGSEKGKKEAVSAEKEEKKQEARDDKKKESGREEKEREPRNEASQDSGTGRGSVVDLQERRRSGQIPSKEEMRRVRSTPLVRKIAAEHGVDISRIQGTGISGRVTKSDIMAYIESGGAEEAPSPREAPAAAPAPALQFPAGAESSTEPLSNMRKTVARHMVESKRISAHVHTLFEVDMTAVDALRRKHKDEWEEREGVKLTFTPFILKAVIEALKAFPVINASMDGEKIIYHRNVNLGVAVALDWGLIVPVIKHADERNLLGLARATQDLADRARAKKLALEETQGSTFTVTNPGSIGGLFGTPIINQPNVAILGVGGVEKRPVVIDDAIAIRSMAYLCLGFDHRLIDGAVADRFMAHVKATLERGTFTDLG